MIAEYAAVLPSPLPGGVQLGIHMTGAAVTAIDLLWDASHVTFVTPAARPVVLLIEHYFATGGCPASGLMPLPFGTAFQRRVWSRLQTIPQGVPVSYGKLAEELQSAARPVAAACKANPIPVLIPCHRVVAASGIGGYMGQTSGPGIAVKEWLLAHEQR